MNLKPPPLLLEEVPSAPTSLLVRLIAAPDDKMAKQMLVAAGSDLSTLASDAMEMRDAACAELDRRIPAPAPGSGGSST